tara:strand:- start:356 stop:829 length:474 start_codon:yes stop_codon:yes gene_type:complete
MLPATTPDVSEEARDVLDWLSDERGGQAEFNIGEHGARRGAPICDRRIAAAIEILSDGIDDGRTPPMDCPPVNRAIMDAVEALHAADIARRKAFFEARAAKVRAAQEAIEHAAQAEANAAHVAARRAAQAVVLRRLLDPASGATDAERAQARELLAR